MRYPLSRHRSLVLGLFVLLLTALGGGAGAPKPGPMGIRAAFAGASALGAVRRLLRDPSPSVRASAYRRLAGDEGAGAERVLIGGLSDEHPYVRRAAAGVLGEYLVNHTRLRRRLRAHRNALVRQAAIRVFTQWLDDDGLAGLMDALTDANGAVRAAALRALAGLRLAMHGGADLPGVPLAGDVSKRAQHLVQDDDALVRAVALDVLRGFDPEALSSDVWTARLGDVDARVRLAALEGSTAVGGEMAVVAILHGSIDAVWSVRLAAVELASAVLDRRVLEPLIARLGDERARIRDAAHASLVRLTGIPFEAQADRWQAWLAGDGATFDPAGRPPSSAVSGLSKGTHTVETGRFMGLPVGSAHIAFVLDASSSMAEALPDGQRRFDVVVASLRDCLGALVAKGGRPAFNLHRFANEVASFRPRSVPLTATRAKQALAWMAQRPPEGRTALYDGIAAALADPAIDTVVVLSDGAPSAGTWFTKTDLLEGVRQANRWRRAQIDVVAVGSQGVAKRWRDVLRRIAKEHSGRYLAR